MLLDNENKCSLLPTDRFELNSSKILSAETKANDEITKIIENKGETNNNQEKEKDKTILTIHDNDDNEKSTLIKTNQIVKKIKDEQENDLPEIDKILNKGGYNIHTIKMIFITWTVLFIDGFHLNFFSSMIIPLSSYYGFSKTEIMIFPAIIFIGNTFGSLSMSFVSKLYKRRNLIIYSVFLSTSFYALMIFVKNVYVFAVSRFFIGFFIGISTTCSLGILTEYMPIKYRGFVLSSIWTGYTTGQFSMLVLMFLFMPNLETERSFTTMVYSLILPIITLLTCIFFAQDGPRNLILNGKEKEAFEILEKIHNSEIPQDMRIRIVDYTKSGSNQQTKGNFFDIFEKTYAKTTILLTFIRSNHALVSFGILAINTLTLNHLNGNHSNNDVSQLIKIDNVINIGDKNKKVLVDELQIVFIIILSDIFAGIQSEIKILGRKYSMAVNYLMGFIFMYICFLKPQYFSLSLAFSLCFVSVASIINHTYCLEIYNTKIRVNAMGFLFACRRIGGFIAQALFVYLESNNMWSPYYISSAILFINVVLCLFLEKETYNKSIE